MDKKCLNLWSKWILKMDIDKPVILIVREFWLESRCPMSRLINSTMLLISPLENNWKNRIIEIELIKIYWYLTTLYNVSNVSTTVYYTNSQKQAFHTEFDV